MYFEYFEVC